MPIYYVYILKKLGRYYVGYTEDLMRRFKEYATEGESALIYYEAYSLKKSATSREKKLKSYCSAWRALRERITA